MSDTFAALATGPHAAAVAIVRINGAEALTIAGQVVERMAVPVLPRHAHRVAFRDARGRFDDGLLLHFPAPHSATGDSLVELHGHGGLAARRLLAAVLEAGARHAAPGEFTRRALANGKLDLLQAEAVQTLVAAPSHEALAQSQRALGGELTARIGALRSQLREERARMEGLLDFASEATGAEEGLSHALATLAGALDALASTHARGRRLASRSRVVLAGPTNAGKSSLLNALLGETRALVDASPGTTRDLVEADLELEGLPVRLVDTAGRREASGVEAAGIALGSRAAEEAELVLWVVDAAQPAPCPDARWLAVASQTDRTPAPPGHLAVSSTTHAGLSALREAIAARLLEGGEAAPLDGLVVLQERQAHGLAEAALRLAEAAGHARRGALELSAEEARHAERALDAVLGGALEGDLLDALFARFCIGK